MDSQAIFQEIKKYLKIIDTAKTAICMNKNGQDSSKLKLDLEKMLDECEYTKKSGATSTLPLHSATNYLDDSRILEEQVVLADQYISQVVEQVKGSFGPFYDEKELRNLDVDVEERVLENQIWFPGALPIRVTTYHDKGRDVYIQVDWEHRQYRTARESEEYGVWKKFTN